MSDSFFPPVLPKLDLLSMSDGVDTDASSTLDLSNLSREYWCFHQWIALISVKKRVICS